MDSYTFYHPTIYLSTCIHIKKNVTLHFDLILILFCLYWYFVEISTQYNRIIGCSDSSKSNEMSVMSLINLLKSALDEMNAIVFVHKRSPNQQVKAHW